MLGRPKDNATREGAVGVGGACPDSWDRTGLQRIDQRAALVTRGLGTFEETAGSIGAAGGASTLAYGDTVKPPEAVSDLVEQAPSAQDADLPPSVPQTPSVRMPDASLPPPPTANPPTHGGVRTGTARREPHGIGLALVRDIAQAHDGEIAGTSEPGQGATFTLTLPAERG